MQKKGFQTFLRNFSKKFSIYSYLPTTKSFFTDKSANFRFRFAITFRPCYFTLKTKSDIMIIILSVNLSRKVLSVFY